MRLEIELEEDEGYALVSRNEGEGPCVTASRGYPYVPCSGRSTFHVFHGPRSMCSMVHVPRVPYVFRAFHIPGSTCSMSHVPRVPCSMFHISVPSSMFHISGSISRVPYFRFTAAVVRRGGRRLERGRLGPDGDRSGEAVRRGGLAAPHPRRE